METKYGNENENSSSRPHRYVRVFLIESIFKDKLSSDDCDDIAKATDVNKNGTNYGHC